MPAVLAYLAKEKLYTTNQYNKKMSFSLNWEIYP
jgi:hypothetical protein